MYVLQCMMSVHNSSVNDHSLKNNNFNNEAVCYTLLDYR